MIFGLGEYRASNVYLSVIPKSEFESGVDASGKSATRYFSGMSQGQPSWSQNESDAVPVVTDLDLANPTIGNVSAFYSQQLGFWLMTFDGGRGSENTTGVYFAYAPQPWGPWSTPQLIFNACRDKGFGNFIFYHYNTVAENNCPSAMPPGVTSAPNSSGPSGPTIGNQTTNNPQTTRGGTYAPLMVQRFTTIEGSTLKIYYTLSTWNPYAAVLMESDFTITPLTVTSQVTPLAHAADGNNFKTTVILTNAGTSPAPYTLQFNNAGGSATVPQVPLELGSLTGTIPAGGSATIRTAGTGSFVGWATLAAPASVGGSLIYSQQTAQLPTVQEGTATLTASGSQHFFLPFDNTNGAATAMALTDPGTASANVTVTLRYSDGTTETPAYGPLASHTHDSFALLTKFPNTSNRSGVAEFVSSAPLYTVSFRFNPTGAFTAFDVVQPGAASPSVTRTLSHAGDGSGFKTTVLLTNTATQAVSYVLRFDDGLGNAPSPPVNLELGSLTGTIPAGGSATIRTAGTGSFVGWAELIAPASVGGSVIYSQPHLTTIQEGTATILSTGTQQFFLPFDNTNGAVTAMALTNSGASAANLTVTVRYSDGSMETPSFPALASRNHQSFTIPGQFPNASNRSGVAEFVSSSPLYSVAFRFNPTGAFTAFGIVPQ